MEISSKTSAKRSAIYFVQSAESFVSPAALRSSFASFRVEPRSVSLELRNFLRSGESAERNHKIEFPFPEQLK